MHQNPNTQEIHRLKALERLQILHTDREPEFDALVELASDVLDCPIALVSLVGRDIQWFKAKTGLEATQTPRDWAFCDHTIRGDDVMVVENATKDPRFRENPLVTGDPNIRFYAGCPISVDGKNQLGTFCVIDSKERQLTDFQKRQLERLARCVEGLIRAFDSERVAKEHAIKEAKLHQTLSYSSRQLEKITEVSGVGGWEIRIDDMSLTWTEKTREIHEVPSDYEPDLTEAINFYLPEAQPKIRVAVESAIATGATWDIELPMITAKGRDIWVRSVGAPMIEGDKTVGVFGTFQDVTARKQQEISLKESESLTRRLSEKMRVTLDSMDQGVSVFNKDGKLVLWNEKYIQIFDKLPGEIWEGASFRDILETEKLKGDFEGDIDQYIDQYRRELIVNGTVHSEFRTRKGKIISSKQAAMPHGGWVGTHSDVTEQVLAQERLEHVSMHDPLTGLANRMKIDYALRDTMMNLTNEGMAACVLIVDLDHFKPVNDSHGHAVGDTLLREVAHRLEGILMPQELAGRLGGDEFAVLCSGPKIQLRQRAGELASLIVTSLGHPYEIQGHEIRIAASVGVSSITEVPMDPSTILAEADHALYKVKGCGRNGFQAFDAQGNVA